MHKHSYHSLRQARLARATKPFNARGARLIRCELCLLAQSHCICEQTKATHCSVDWILLMHEDEVLKPTNTGRLVAALFPATTFVFEWGRVHPPKELQKLISDPSRLNLLVFPAEDALTPSCAQRQAAQNNQRLTLILLDGTWKQARKMFNRTPWLAGLPSVSLPLSSSQYALRKAAHEGCLSTAEAAIGLLDQLDITAAAALRSYFTRFNEAYVHSRGVRPEPDGSENISEQD
ncbi:MAG: DTW domain-containing protein [Marinagarivorans sp.]